MPAPAILILLVLLGLALGYAAFRDLRERIIPNGLNAAIALGAPLWWWATGLSLWPGVPLQLLLAGVLFALFVAAFMMGAMGGGDVKLIGALALWLPLEPAVAMLFLMSVVGGLVTLVTMAAHRWRRAEGRPEIPYGVAIAIAGGWEFGERYLYHFA